MKEEAYPNMAMYKYFMVFQGGYSEVDAQPPSSYLKVVGKNCWKIESPKSH